MEEKPISTWHMHVIKDEPDSDKPVPKEAYIRHVAMAAMPMFAVLMMLWRIEALAGPRGTDTTPKQWAIATLAIAGVSLMWGGLFALYGWGRKCPDCKYPWAKRKLSVKKVRENSREGLVTTHDVHRGADGKVIGTTERLVIGTIVTSIYVVQNECKRCGYSWQTIVGEANQVT